jgi:hypothetical protein
MDEELTEKQTNSRPWLYKKGQSGNPNGRPKGSISMKQYVKNKLAAMTEEEREVYLEGVDKKIIWEMAEGKAKQDVEVSGELTSKIISVDE